MGGWRLLWGNNAVQQSTCISRDHLCDVLLVSPAAGTGAICWAAELLLLFSGLVRRGLSVSKDGAAGRRHLGVYQQLVSVGAKRLAYLVFELGHIAAVPARFYRR